MRLFSRSDFLALPDGIAYCKGKPFYFEHLAFKTESMEHDWAAFDPQYIDAKSSDEAADRLEEMLESNQVSYPMETADCRDGSFDGEEIFLVFESADLERLRGWIDEAIIASRPLTRDGDQPEELIRQLAKAAAMKEKRPEHITLNDLERHRNLIAEARKK